MAQLKERIPMKNTKMTKTVLATALTATTLGSVATPLAFADKIRIDPTFTYGETLNNQQLQQTRQALGVSDDAKDVEIHVNELNALLHDNYPYQQVYSSAFIESGNNDGGVEVDIVTPENITDISERDYENAAITSGAVDVSIKVASAVKVDGSGALAGVYKTFQENGQALDQESVEVAQEELQTTSEINSENEGKEGYSNDALNAAVAEIKKEIQEYKDDNDGQINDDQVKVIINNVVNNYNLDGVLSEENIQSIAQLMNRFSQIELSKEQKDALNDLGGRLQQAGDEIISKAKQQWNNLDDEDKANIKGWWQRIVDSVKGFFQSITGAVKGNDNAEQTN